MFPLISYLISQFIVIQTGGRVSRLIESLIDNETPKWLSFFLEVLVEYFQGTGDWTYVWIVLFVIILIIFAHIFGNKESNETIRKLLDDKRKEEYLITRIEKLETERLIESTKTKLFVENKEKLNDELIELKSKLFVLQIDDDVIGNAQAIIDKEKKMGVPRALELIEKENNTFQVKKLREQNIKQSKISRYKAGLYEWINQWSKADIVYKESN